MIAKKISYAEVEALAYEDGRILTVIDRASKIQYAIVDDSQDKVRAVQSLNAKEHCGLIQWDDDYPWIAKLFKVFDGETFAVDQHTKLIVKNGRWIS